MLSVGYAVDPSALAWDFSEAMIRPNRFFGLPGQLPPRTVGGCQRVSPTHTRKGSRLYRYYVTQDVLKRGAGCLPGRPGAGGGDRGGGDRPTAWHSDRQPEIVVGTWCTARGEEDGITEDEAREALLQFDPLWDELFPAEQARIVQLLVERVDVRTNGVEVRLRPNGLARAGAGSGGHNRRAA